jgi:mannosyltransferase
VLAGALTLVAIYLLGKELYGRSAGLLAALLLALHASHIRYSQEARSYALLGLALVFAAYFLARAVHSTSDNDWTAFVLLSALSVYLHFFAALVILAFLCSLLFLPASTMGARRWLGVLTLLGFLTAPAVWYIFTHRNIGLIDWIPAPSWLLLARCATMLLGIGGFLGLIYAFACVLPLLRTRLATRSTEAHVGLAALPLLWSVLPMLLLLVASLYRPVLVERYLIMSVPGIVLLAGYGITCLQDRLRVPFAAVLVLLSAIGLQRSFQASSSEGEDWRGAVQYVVQHSQPRDVVVLDNGIVRPVFEYYRQQFNAPAPRVYSFAPRGDDLTYLDFANITSPRVLDRVAQVHNRVWIFEWGTGNGLIPEMERRFRQAAAQQFLHVNVKLYVRDFASTPH